MEPKSLVYLHRKLQRVLDANFPEQILIESKVISVDYNIGIVNLGINGYSIECRASCDIMSLKENDHICLEGRLWLNENGKIVIKMNRFHMMNQLRIYDEKARNYDRLKKIIEGDKIKSIIKRIRTRNEPQRVYNIGIVVLPNNDKYFENILDMIQQKHPEQSDLTNSIPQGSNCLQDVQSFSEKTNRLVGQIFVFHPRAGFLDCDLRLALRYFERFHNVDLVCILSIQISDEDVFDLSCKKNVNFLLKRKYPYLVSISNVNLEPLTASLSNKKFSTVNEFVDFLRIIQEDDRKRITRSLSRALELFDQRIAKYNRKLHELEQWIAELGNSVNFEREYISNILNNLKSLVLQKLDEKKMYLDNVEFSLTKKLVNDAKLIRITEEIIKHEMEQMKKSVNIS
ncbi:MAG: hypothetical protein QW303_04240 [Nitrososphaerota archaeon]